MKQEEIEKLWEQRKNPEVQAHKAKTHDLTQHLGSSSFEGLEGYSGTCMHTLTKYYSKEKCVAEESHWTTHLTHIDSPEYTIHDQLNLFYVDETPWSKYDAQISCGERTGEVHGEWKKGIIDVLSFAELVNYAREK